MTVVAPEIGTPPEYCLTAADGFTAAADQSRIGHAVGRVVDRAGRGGHRERVVVEHLRRQTG